MRLTSLTSLTSLALLGLLVALAQPSLARRGRGMGGGMKSTGSRGTSTTSNRGATSSAKKSMKNSPPPPAGPPKQADSNPARPGTNQWGYPDPGRGPYRPQAGGFGAGVPGGRMNYNPNNRIPSPGYAGSYWPGGSRDAGGSPFSRSVQGMGMNPSYSSKGFGRRAVLASSTGVLTGMAVGYGLGRFPRLPFHSRSDQEERYYNHYMHQQHAGRSAHGQHYEYSPAPVTFDQKMEECMKNPDRFPSETTQGKKGPAGPAAAAPATPAPTPAPGSPTAVPTSPTLPRATDNSTSSNASGSAIENTALSQPGAAPPPAPGDLSRTEERGDEDGEDTVSIMEIGYPALMDQFQTRRCVDLYVEYASQFLKQRPPPGSGAQGSATGLQTAVVLLLTLLVSRT